ncbi:YpeB-like protein with putative protease inhibitory function [Labedella gwakjiensis]|nr:PepSY domain-containing protein [Labedella gwakjiensis]PSL39271.1 YpeB-like protein with putative protease inhibitory function [Labedella gwakjiensis]
MNTNPDLPENRPQDSSAEAASSPAAPADHNTPVGQPAPTAATAPTEQVAPAASTATETTAATKPRRRIGKRTWIIGGAVAGLLVLGGAGFAIADELNDGSDTLDDATRDRVAAAATAYTGGGELIDAERDDDGGYDAEVRFENGTEVDLDLDENLAVISSDTDRTDDDGDRNGDDGDDVSDDQGTGSGSGASTAPTAGTGDDARVDDDTPLTADETTAATEAALAETGEGEVVDIDRSDDRDHAFEVEVRLTDGSEVEVDLDADFGVVRTSPSD